MRNIIILCLLLTGCAKDKVLHASYGTAIGAGSVTALNMMNYEGDRPLTASIVVVAAGLGKELYDEYDYGGFDYLDLLATVIPGVAASYGWHWSLNYNVTVDEDCVMFNYNKQW